jgi:isopentenyl diphosphate isomerase/L-lactate dehydrogenase-like FMN-dependent dehydrogenase
MLLGTCLVSSELHADNAQAQTNLPVIVKGVQTVEDIELSAKHGADAVIIVSNIRRKSAQLPNLKLKS